HTAKRDSDTACVRRGPAAYPAALAHGRFDSVVIGRTAGTGLYVLGKPSDYSLLEHFHSHNARSQARRSSSDLYHGVWNRNGDSLWPRSRMAIEPPAREQSPAGAFEPVQLAYADLRKTPHRHP